jgi:hypothetical protein
MEVQDGREKVTKFSMKFLEIDASLFYFTEVSLIYN